MITKIFERTVGKYSASRFGNGMICFNIVHANTKSIMKLRQSICTRSQFVTYSSRYSSSNALFSRWPPSSTTLISQLPVNLSFCLKHPFVFSHSTITFPFFHVTIRPKDRRHIDEPVGTRAFSQHCLWFAWYFLGNLSTTLRYTAESCVT